MYATSPGATLRKIKVVTIALSFKQFFQPSDWQGVDHIISFEPAAARLIYPEPHIGKSTG